MVDPNEIGQAKGSVELHQDGQADINYFIIDDSLYQLMDLLGRGQLIIPEGVQFAIVQVKGTSMNKLDIQDGDFVLIRRQETANHMDIVSVECLEDALEDCGCGLFLARLLESSCPKLQLRCPRHLTFDKPPCCRVPTTRRSIGRQSRSSFVESVSAC